MKIFAVIATVLMAANSYASSRACGILYTAERSRHAQKLTLVSGEGISDLNRLRDRNGRDFDNRIEKVKVYQGCTLISYQYQDYNINYNTGYEMNGFVLVSSANPNVSRDPQTTYLSAYHQDKISSVKCFCQ